MLVFLADLVFTTSPTLLRIVELAITSRSGADLLTSLTSHSTVPLNLTLARYYSISVLHFNRSVLVSCSFVRRCSDYETCSSLVNMRSRRD